MNTMTSVNSNNSNVDNGYWVINNSDKVSSLVGRKIYMIYKNKNSNKISFHTTGPKPIVLTIEPNKESESVVEDGCEINQICEDLIHIRGMEIVDVELKEKYVNLGFEHLVIVRLTFTIVCKTPIQGSLIEGDISFKEVEIKWTGRRFNPPKSSTYSTMSVYFDKF